VIKRNKTPKIPDKKHISDDGVNYYLDSKFTENLNHLNWLYMNKSVTMKVVINI